MELKKVNSKHILKSTLTPQMPRKSFSVDSGIDKDDIGQSVAGSKFNRRDSITNVSTYIYNYVDYVYYY